MRYDLYEAYKMYDIPEGVLLVDKDKAVGYVREIRLMQSLNKAVARLFNARSDLVRPFSIQRQDDELEGLEVIRAHPEQPTTYYMDFQVIEDEESALYLGLFLRLRILNPKQTNSVYVVSLTSAQTAAVARRLHNNKLFRARLVEFLKDKTRRLQEATEKITAQLEHNLLFSEDATVNRVFWHRGWRDVVRFEQRRREAFATPGLAGVLMRSLEEWELSVRTYSCLKNAGIENMGDLLKRTRTEVMAIKNFGSKCYAEIREILDSLGVRLAVAAEPLQEADKAPPS